MKNKIDIEMVEMSGLASTLVSLRKPFKGELPSEVNVKMKIEDSEEDEVDSILTLKTESHLKSRDLTLMKALVKKGPSHAKAIRGINVTIDLRAPRYFWSEHDTYKIGVTPLSSESTMHTIMRDKLDISCFSDLSPVIFKVVQEEVENIKISPILSRTEKLRAIKKCLPESFYQTRTINYNYQALRNIYFQRFDHRLQEWGYFCEWIKTLPYAQELILNE